MNRTPIFRSLLFLGLVTLGFLFACKRNTDNGGPKPTAAFSFNITGFNTVTFTNNTDASGLANPTYRWDFGFPSSNPQTTQRDPGAVEYPAEGNYDVKLTVKADGGSDSLVQILRLVITNEQKLAGFNNTTGKTWRWDLDNSAFPFSSNERYQISNFTSTTNGILYPNVQRTIPLLGCQVGERYTFYPDGRYVVSLGGGNVSGPSTNFECRPYANIPDTDDRKPLLQAQWAITTGAAPLTPAVPRDLGIRLNTGRAFLGALGAASTFNNAPNANVTWSQSNPNLHIVRQLDNNVLIVEHRRSFYHQVPMLFLCDWCLLIRQKIQFY